MSFDTRERSRDDAAPIEFLEFERAGIFWRYTSAEQARLLNGESWAPLEGLARDAIEQNAEDITMQLHLTLPRTAAIAPEFAGSLLPAPMHVTLWRNHVDELDGEAQIIWWGEVAGQSFTGSDLSLTCTSEEAAFGAQLGRLPYMRTCPHMLYDEMCGADPALHELAATVDALSADGRTVTLSAPVHDFGATPPHYPSGVLFWGERSSQIRTEEIILGAAVFTLQTPLPMMLVGDGVIVRHGCTRTAEVCDGLFNNLERFGGFALIPLRNPWKRVT